jgi:hypothetical protein
MNGWQAVVFGGLAGLVLAGKAAAQQPYPLHEMNFDMWCQEEKHLPPARCDKRLPQDDAEFQDYRATIEKYEIPYLQEKRDEQNLNRVIIHGDPLDNPVRPSTPQNPAAGTGQAGVPSPQ